MTIEEIINAHKDNLLKGYLKDEDKNIIERLLMESFCLSTQISLCQEVRRLTIEECKKKVVVINLDGERSISHYTDYEAFPTDLNNIEI